MEIRKSTFGDAYALMVLFEEARGTIALLGIDQWQNGYPSRDVVGEDIALERSYAKTGEGIDGLLSLIGDVIMRTKRVCRLLIPYSEQGIVSSLYNSYTVSSVEYTDSGVEVVAVLDARGMGLYADLIKGEP